MAPPAASLRKRKNKKPEGKGGEPIDMFGPSAAGSSDFDIPMPPSMSKEIEKENAAAAADDDSDDDANMDALPSKSKYNQKKGGHGDIKLAKADKGIKMVPLILLLIMTGTTLIPALLFMGDSISGLLAKNDIMGSIGYRLGIGAVPRKRVISFYEKHNPEKLEDVPKVLANHYGDYPKLIRKLERKYQDYGYFMGWEEDEAPMRIIQDQMQEAYSIWIQQYWNKYAPVMVRTRVRNIKYNLASAYKRSRKIWRKHIWPLLEPLFGVPDERTAAKQKRQDAKMAQEKRKQSSSSGTRRKNKDFRDDVED